MKTFGSLRHEDRAWVIEAEPHVVIRLKRVFPRIQQGKGAALKLRASTENSRDLQWFIERYPLDVAPKIAELLEARSAEHREHETIVAQLLAGIGESTPFDLALPPRAYQKSAAELCLRTGGLLLADDLGLGKTVSAICLLSDPRARPAVVVTMTHLTRQWQDEIARFAPQLRTHIVKKGTPYDLTASRRTQRGQLSLVPTLPDVVILNYHKLAGWAETLAPITRALVFDETQELRHPDSQRYAAAKIVAGSASLRLGLTATPIYNYGDEIHNVVDVLLPDALGSREEFIREWCSSTDSRGRGHVGDPAAFGTYLRSTGIMLRRTRAEVGRELPGLTKIVHPIESDADELKKIESSAARLAEIVLSRGTIDPFDRGRAAEELNSLIRQATGIAKAPFVAAFVRMLVETGEKVVLFGWHREVYGIWLDLLSDFAPAMYTGSETPNQKNEAKRRFVDGETSVLIVSLRAGAGLDGLQYASRTVVHGELDWSPAVHNQCDGRVYRDGQVDPVQAWYLVSDEGSDPIVVDVLGLKAAQAGGIVNPDAEIVELQQTDGKHAKRLAETYLRRTRDASVSTPSEASRKREVMEPRSNITEGAKFDDTSGFGSAEQEV